MLRTKIMRGRGTGFRRRAAAVVEMAVVMPLLLTMLFGVVEYGRRLMVHQTLINAAREATRTAVLQGSTDEDIRNRVAAYMTPAGLTSYTVNITHGTTDNPIEVVEVVVQKSSVTLFGNFFGSCSGTLSSSCSMRKEGSV